MIKKPPYNSVTKQIKASLILSLIFFISSCSSDKKSTNKKEIKETLRSIDASIQNAITQKNVDLLMPYYADDANLLPTAEPKVEGKAAIKKEWQHVFAIPDFVNKSQLTKVEISEDGSMAYTMGSYMAMMQGEDGKAVHEPGKWVTIWKKQSNGSWQIIVDTYNTDVPPPDHK